MTLSNTPATGKTKPKSNTKMLRRLLGFARKPPVEGFVDRVVAGEVHGWAWDPARPDRRLLVVVTLDGVVQAETLAELPRPDLATAGKGDGKHAFRLRLPAGLTAETPGRLQIQVMIGSQRFPLQRGALVLPASEATSAAAETALGPRPVTVGFIESIGARGIKGWAVNPNNPETPAMVDLFDGELFLGSATAGLDRPRLQKAGAPAGARGFSFKLPDGRTVADGAALRARIAGTRFELRHSKSVLDGARSDGADDESHADAVPTTPTAAGDDRVEHPAADLAPVSGVLYLQLGQGDARAVEDHETEVARALRLDETANPDALEAAVLERDLVALLPPGCSPRDGAHSALMAAPRSADILAWPLGDSEPRGDARLEVLLGRRAGAPLALRSAALLSYPGALAADLSRGTDRVAHWAARQPGLRWETLSVPLTEASVATATVGGGGDAADASPGRVTLAAWGAWLEGPPPMLASLLEGAEGFDVQVLVPASPLLASWSDALQRMGDARVTIRAVDGAGDDRAADRRALLRAATGEVVVLFDQACDGLGRDALQALWTWSKTPGVGVATGVVGGGAEMMAGLDLKVADGETRAIAGLSDGIGVGRLVFGAAPVLAAFNREALRRSGVFEEPDAAEPWDDLGWALRLRRRGYAAVALNAVAAQLPAERLEPWLRRPFPLVLRAGFAPELRDGLSSR